MTAVVASAISDLTALVGREIGPSAWREVSQEEILRFAELSGDRQWIHVDAERARDEGPFGAPVAHGNLTLALIDGFREELLDVRGFEVALNHGWNRVRFPAPVRAGSRIRASVALTDVNERRIGWWEVTERWTVAVEGEARPGCVAERVNRVQVEGGAS